MNDEKPAEPIQTSWGWVEIPLNGRELVYGRDFYFFNDPNRIEADAPVTVEGGAG